MKTIIESIQSGNSIKNLKDGIVRAVDMRDFPYIRKIARDYKKRLQDPEFLSALDAISGCDNDFKVAAVYDMMGYIDAQYDINDGDEDAMDQGTYTVIKMISDPSRNQNDFSAFIHSPSRGGNPAWYPLSQQYAEVAKLFLNPDFELI